jgi:hypothetical protein
VTPQVTGKTGHQHTGGAQLMMGPREHQHTSINHPLLNNVMVPANTLGKHAKFSVPRHQMVRCVFNTKSLNPWQTHAHTGAD